MVIRACDHAIALKRLQGLGQHPLRHTVNLLAQFAEAMRPFLQNNQDENRPAPR